MTNKTEFEQGKSYLVSYLINGATSLCKIKVLELTDTTIRVDFWTGEYWVNKTTYGLDEFNQEYKIVEEIFS